MILRIHAICLGVWKMHTKLGLNTSMENTLKYVGGGWSVILKLILEEQCVKNPSRAVSFYKYDDEISGSLNQKEETSLTV
jgi:hypothetical protein